MPAKNPWTTTRARSCRFLIRITVCGSMKLVPRLAVAFDIALQIRKSHHDDTTSTAEVDDQ
jgi:hypothetical protein